MKSPGLTLARSSRIFLTAAMALLAVSCATPKPARGPVVFVPEPPELPRIQFLTSFNGLRDIEEQSGFDRFVVGERLNLQLDKPYGVAIHDGKIYVCDTNTTVIVLDLKKKQFGSMPGAVGAGRLIQPLNISIEDDGTKYVTDPVRGQIVVFDAKDQYLRALGDPSSWKPVDAVPYGDRLYVADMAHGLVKVLDKKSGELLKTIGDKGEQIERIDRPSNLAFDDQGDLYVSDIGRFRVARYDRDGHYKSSVGKLGDNLGHFARPKGVAIDPEERLYAVDAAFNNVQIFSPAGRLLMYFGGGGEKPGGLLLPAKVAIDRENLEYFEKYVDPGFRPEYLILVTSQFGDRKVNVFAFGQQKGARYPTDEELLRQVDEKRKQELEKEQQKPPAP